MNSRIPSLVGLHDRIEPAEDVPVGEATNHSMGELIRVVLKLTDAQVEQIVACQQRRGIRFGEAAVALGLATSDDVLRALSRQYDYAYLPELLEDGKRSELVVAANPFSEEAEGFRELRSQLMLGALNAQNPRSALAVLSPNVGDGKTYIAANLAVAFSQLGVRTLLIDADMRTPRQHELFALDNHSCGLSNVLSRRSTGNSVHSVKNLPNLFVMPCGATPPNPLELLQHSGFTLLLFELLAEFTHVIIDTPASAHGADARVIAASCGASLVVGRRARSRVKEVKDLLAHLKRLPGIVTGVVLNDH